ncbi:hypothetical protein BKA59DRAFT_466469 [Fusarium tricinctum]|uniref:DUF676 domain-containing protein n=1 Tax=Fusarium tricinctum TaxID=61284 RepID=A0A8K0WJ54_9HYPO|nr:hypothetical protein BKA59DRAFT_466469 [Fusarium tricinctum]
MRPRIDLESHLPYIEPPSHVGLKAIEIPPPYTGTPWLIFISDVKLFFQNIFYLPYLFIPLYPWHSGSLCEMYPSWDNLTDIALHLLLSVAQLTFLVSLVTLAFLPAFTYIGFIAVFLAVNEFICWHFNNGIPSSGLRSKEDAITRRWPRHDDEAWIFLNGICVGKNWLQKNIDRISRTFHRPVIGIHNKTAGVVFDLIQCLVQRALLYATQDVRECYVLVKNALLDDRKKKVIFILHSQGGIEGGMIIDWLLDEMPLESLQKLEVYTFGNMANHFSNPCRDNDPSLPVIPHIEHYVNEKDFACRFGVLNFTRNYTQNENRFAGKVFINRSGGHQLNQHYLDDMFPLDKSLRKTRDTKEGDFMNRKVRCRKDGTIKEISRAELPLGFSVSRGNDAVNGRVGLHEVPRMGDLSRLWKYRNGQVPDSHKNFLTDGG